jgi:hypothetical protein
MTESDTWYKAAELLLEIYPSVVCSVNITERNDIITKLHSDFIENGLNAFANRNGINNETY